jgi:hypothetical protein
LREALAAEAGAVAACAPALPPAWPPEAAFLAWPGAAAFVAWPDGAARATCAVVALVLACRGAAAFFA